MSEPVLYDSILSDIANLALVLFGFSVSLFTVIYSFLISKRDELREYSDQLKKGNKDLLLAQRKTFARKYIGKFRKINNHLILNILIDLTIYIFSMSSKYLICDIELKKVMTWLISFISTLTLLYIITMLIITIKDYFQTTKLD